MSTITLTEDYAHPKEKIFKAFSDPKMLAKWIAPSDQIPTEIKTYNFSPEGHYEITFEFDGTKHHLEGQFLQINPHDKLIFSWIWQHPAPHAGVESLVEMTLKQIDDTTKLTLIHSKLDATNMPERHKSGWLGSLARLNLILGGE